eukprot:s3180_g6.t2
MVEAFEDADEEASSLVEACDQEEKEEEPVEKTSSDFQPLVQRWRLRLLEQVERRDSQLQGLQALYEQYSECRRSLQAADANKRMPGTGYLVPKDVAEAKELHNAAEKLLRHKESQIQELQRHNKELLDELQRKELAHTHTCREATRLSQENGHLKATLGRLVAQQKRELQGELQEKEIAHLETCREATRLAQENGHLKSELSRLQQRLRQQTDTEVSSEAQSNGDAGKGEHELLRLLLSCKDVSRLQALADKLAKWLLAEEGFGRSLDHFFRAHSQYFDDYQEEHALHYTTLHKDRCQGRPSIFCPCSILRLFGSLPVCTLASLGATEESVTDPAAEVDLVEMMLEAVDYQKWIGSIFAIKRRIRERRKVRARKAPPPPPPSESKVGVRPGESLHISLDGVGYDVANRGHPERATTSPWHDAADMSEHRRAQAPTGPVCEIAGGITKLSRFIFAYQQKLSEHLRAKFKDWVTWRNAGGQLDGDCLANSFGVQQTPMYIVYA